MLTERFFSYTWLKSYQKTKHQNTPKRGTLEGTMKPYSTDFGNCPENHGLQSASMVSFHPVIPQVPLKVPTKRLDVLMFIVRCDDDGDSFDRCIWDQSMPKYRMCHQPRFPWNYGDFPSKKLPEMGVGFQFKDFTWNLVVFLNNRKGSISISLGDHRFKREWCHDRLETTLPTESCILAHICFLIIGWNWSN